MRSAALPSRPDSAPGDGSVIACNDHPPPETADREQRWRPRRDHRYRGHRLRLKRLADRATAGVLLTLLSPALLMAAVAVRLSSPGPCIYRQQRVGRHGEPFTIYKFRSMRLGADELLERDPELYARYRDGGFKIATSDDPRVTAVGRFLRKSSLDELPQLVNVLRGEMSLVGPRPVVPDELLEYGRYVEAYLMALPGITGPWQVSGRDAVKFPGRAKFDADYIDQWSLRLDLRILLRTIPAALSARGVE